MMFHENLTAADMAPPSLVAWSKYSNDATVEHPENSAHVMSLTEALTEELFLMTSNEGYQHFGRFRLRQSFSPKLGKVKIYLTCYIGKDRL